MGSDDKGHLSSAAVDEEDGNPVLDAPQILDESINLTTESSGVVLAFDIVRTLGKPTQKHPPRELPVFQQGALPDELILVEKNLRYIHALNALMHLPWWNQIWVVEEVVLSQRLALFCGGASEGWDTFAKAGINFQEHQICCGGPLGRLEDLMPMLQRFARLSAI